MRFFGFASITIALTFFTCLADAQQVVPAQSAQGIQILQRSLGGLIGSGAVTDVTVTATARRIAGSDDETGTASLKALASGEARMDLSFPSGQRNEIWKNAGTLQGSPTGQWNGPDGKTHAMTVANLMTDSSWFFPAITLYKWLSMPGHFVSLVGQESRYGVDVLHVTVSLTASAFPADMAATFQHLSQTEAYIDASSGLPIAIAFNIHADNNDLLDIPVEIHFSDYRPVNTIQVPFHVERFLNRSMVLDLKFDTVVLNSGVSSSDFQVQDSTRENRR